MSEGMVPIMPAYMTNLNTLYVKPLGESCPAVLALASSRQGGWDGLMTTTHHEPLTECNGVQACEAGQQGVMIVVSQPLLSKQADHAMSAADETPPNKAHVSRCHPAPEQASPRQAGQISRLCASKTTHS